MLDGFKVGGDHPVWQIAAKVNLFSTGFTAMAWAALQAERENKAYDEQDLFLMYSHDFFKEKSSMINFHGFFDYWIFPNTAPVVDAFGDTISTVKKHGNKFQLGLSMPQLISISGSNLIPSYNVYHWLYWELDRADLNRSGDHHELLLEYYKPIPRFIPGATYQYAGGSGSLNYNSGAFGVKQRLSHATASLAAGVYALQSIFEFTLNHQWTYEPTVNPGNELWTTFSFIKKY